MLLNKRECIIMLARLHEAKEKMFNNSRLQVVGCNLINLGESIITEFSD